MRLRNDVLVEIGSLLLEQEYLILIRGGAEVDRIVRNEVLLDGSRRVESLAVTLPLVVVQGCLCIWEEGLWLRRLIRRR